MTIKELLEAIEEAKEFEKNIENKEIAYFVKDNPNGTFDAITIHSIGLSQDYLLLANKCPNCNN